MKLPKGLNFQYHDEEKVFAIYCDLLPGDVITIDTDKLENGVLYLPKGDGDFQKRVVTQYCVRLGIGILNYWSATRGPEGVRGDSN